MSEDLYRGERAADLGPALPIEVLEENWEAAQVFELCSWEAMWPGMGEKPFFWRIPAEEVLSNLKMLDVARGRWATVISKIRKIMEPAARMYLNTGKAIDL